ncbi:MAG: hypothetical protein K2W96_10035, partial [Gemmataceae bacterium]|nr:hypothetical protein [Gemmataceae bacterium]
MIPPPEAAPRPSRWLRVALVAALAQAALMGVLLARFGGDPSAFVCAANSTAGRYPLERVSFGLSDTGHDGQFCYVLARA